MIYCPILIAAVILALSIFAGAWLHYRLILTQAERATMDAAIASQAEDNNGWVFL
jgi:hypothetical protein